MSKISDPDLEHINNIRHGDDSAFSALFRQYYEQLYYFASRFLKDSQTSENIVQDVFVKLWEQREKLEISTNVKSYLYTSVKNHSLNYLKRESRLFSIDDQLNLAEEKSISTEDDYIKDESFRAVHKAIDELPEKCRQIYLMKRYDDLSYNEISEILGISINTIKTQMKRALKALSEKLVYLKYLVLFFRL